MAHPDIDTDPTHVISKNVDLMCDVMYCLCWLDNASRRTSFLYARTDPYTSILVCNPLFCWTFTLSHRRRGERDGCLEWVMDMEPHCWRSRQAWIYWAFCGKSYMFNKTSSSKKDETIDLYPCYTGYPKPFQHATERLGATPIYTTSFDNKLKKHWSARSCINTDGIRSIAYCIVL